MKLDIYVNYRGTCEEAYRFYESAPSRCEARI